MGLADLHLHTIYSYDGTASLPAVLTRAKQLGLDVIAITDHDEIAGALKALEIAPMYGVEVIPGIEITTAEGDLLALFIREKVAAGLSLVETVMKVRELGGVCIAPHPMAGGMGMKSLNAMSILKALRNRKVAETLIGIETYNGTSIDRVSNHSASLLSNRLKLARTGSSDAHILETIGFGATEFEGKTAADLLTALKNRTTKVRKQNEWGMFKILGSWALNYLGSLFARRTITTS
ncbi:PHP domain-containing protein [Candidatus Villigracilis affinis]|uniref:PHP domain-containing protein n=1 Tax=Candidatus Villigracilis affinis TaxID=3140682 RepID=UPI001DA03ABB|nr:PHP domain-containing protein [Anaerolineales bacterium]